MYSMERILARVQNDPITHLSCRSLLALEGYMIGYALACTVWSIPQPYCDIDRDKLFRWLRNQVKTTPEHAGRLNAYNWLNIAPWAHYLSIDDREAFDTYFMLRTQAPRTTANNEPEQSSNTHPAPTESLQDTLQRVRERPGMYFGNRFQTVQLWTFCNGFYWAEQDRCLEPSLAEPLFTTFPDWLATRYPFSRGVPWHRLFNALALGEPLSSFDCFLEHLELYLSGEPSDTPDPTMQRILKNILKNHAVDS